MRPLPAPKTLILGNFRGIAGAGVVVYNVSNGFRAPRSARAPPAKPLGAGAAFNSKPLCDLSSRGRFSSGSWGMSCNSKQANSVKQCPGEPCNSKQAKLVKQCPEKSCNSKQAKSVKQCPGVPWFRTQARQEHIPTRIYRRRGPNLKNPKMGL